MIFPGIPPHVDTHSPFEDTILSLSLGAKVRSRSGICDLIIVIVATDLWAGELLSTQLISSHLKPASVSSTPGAESCQYCACKGAYVHTSCVLVFFLRTLCYLLSVSHSFQFLLTQHPFIQQALKELKLVRNFVNKRMYTRVIDFPFSCPWLFQVFTGVVTYKLRSWV